MTFWATSPPEPTTLTGRFRAAVNRIGLKLGAHLSHNRHLEPILGLVFGYLSRAASRFDRLIARWQAGKLTSRSPRPRTPREASIPAEAPPDGKKLRLPSRAGWILNLVQPTAQIIPELERLVASPEMAELLAAAPQAGRILRPLFRMYGLPVPEVLRLPSRPRRPRAPRPLAAPRVTARERRVWLTYSPGRLGETQRRTHSPGQKKSPP